MPRGFELYRQALTNRLPGAVGDRDGLLLNPPKHGLHQPLVAGDTDLNGVFSVRKIFGLGSTAIND